MKKHAIRLMCLLMTLMLSGGLWTTAFAALDKSGYCGDNVRFSYNFSSGYLRVWGTGPMYDGTYIFDGFLEQNSIMGSSVKKIQIERGVTHIGAFAFYGCDYVTSISISDTVTSIGNYAFSESWMTKSFKLPDSITSIGVGAFKGCTMLESINIPDGVTRIEDWTFFECDFLTAIDLPDGLKSIGEFAFADTGLTQITIPQGVTTIGYNAFSDCYDLKKVTIPGSVEVIGHGAFNDCSGLQSVNICKGVREIDDFAFDGCDKLTSVSIPDTVERIGEMAFYGCDSLTTVVLPASVKVIEDSAFNWYYGRTSGPEHIYILNRGDIDIGWTPFAEGATIYCYRGTEAAIWAEKKAKFNDYTIVYLDGDADGNGKVNLQDFLRIMQYAAGWSVVIDDSADMNVDGTIDVNDAILLLESL